VIYASKGSSELATQSYKVPLKKQLIILFTNQEKMINKTIKMTIVYGVDNRSKLYNFILFALAHVLAKETAL
ncbi:hypothetical protein ACJX0J_038210, partial [Zea mays]